MPDSCERNVSGVSHYETALPGGYACLATAQASRCAPSREQVCRAKEGDVECLDSSEL